MTLGAPERSDAASIRLGQRTGIATALDQAIDDALARLHGRRPALGWSR